jgi:pimeloyl-ACP methyl ester carboxylesterase
VDAGDVDAANEEEMRLWVDGRRSAPPAGAAVRAAIAPVNRELLDRQRAFPDERELEPELPDRLADIGCPVLVVSGDADVDIAIEWCRVLDERIPDARLLVWEDVAHLLTLERPEEFARLVLEFTA